jgi:hypothetical protein
MFSLLIHDQDCASSPDATTRFGGLPSVAKGGFAWPTCRICSGNMQFVGQIRSELLQRLYLAFMCQNDPGMCDEWDPNAGGNVVISQGTENLVLANAPDEGVTLRRACQSVTIETIEAEDYEAARKAWSAKHGRSSRFVLGHIGGDPTWIQGDETPECDFCAQPMQLVAQLEQGPDGETEANFGGGCAYLFGCACEHKAAKFLWQC